MSGALNYVVYALGYNPESGGTIFLHQLVHRLNSLGQRAALWPMAPIYDPGLRNRLRRLIRPEPFVRAPDLDTPLATRADLGANAVVVYSEMIRGNPLRQRNVVRWLLYKPGLLHPFEFGPDEMFFRVGEITDIPEITGGAPDLLLWTLDKTYCNENRPDRKGACFIVRKGGHKPRISQTDGALQIDQLPHAQVNDIFNRCEVFYPYDEATMYSQYAAICGCLSVVVPGSFASREDWVKNHQTGRYGIAYGLGDLEHARATRHLVEGMLREKEAEGRRSVERFVWLTRQRLAPGG